MKIGILTHHYISNFGAFLQAYALQKAVKKMYPNDEVYIINHINIKHFLINNGGWFRYYKDRESMKSWLQKIKLPITFYKARKEFLETTRVCFSVKEINDLELDCIIIGSDEVWNYKETKGNAKVKFGYGLDCKKIIAYAPSVGKSAVGEEDIPTYVKEGLDKFSAISARDDLTALFVEKVVGKQATRVLDPTFLSEFPKVKNVIKEKKPYILFYYCEHLPLEMRDRIVEFAKAKGYTLYGAGECDKLYKEVTVNLSPFEWVQMFRDAEFVFTGTFHGAVFSVLNRKQFACYLTNPSRIKKVSALLSELNISDRVIKEELNLEKLVEEKIDYNSTYEIINEKRKNSLDYLHNSIRDN